MTNLKWFIDLLSMLVGRPLPLTLLIMGSIFALVAFAELPISDSSLVQSETIWESIVLGILSFVLIGASLRLAFRDARLGEKLEQKKKEIQGKDKEIEALEESIRRAKEFIQKNRDEKNREFFDRVISILGGLGEDISEFFASSSDRLEASNWIKQRVERWKNNINVRQYSDYGVSDENLEKFKSDIVEHFDLLAKNILEDKNSAPSLVNPPVSQSLGSSNSYKKFFVEIQVVIHEELHDESVLENNSVQIIKEKLSAFIEFIGYTS